MKNAEHWRASKYVFRGEHLIASRDPREVGYGSRLMADLVARAYGDALPLYARGRLLDLGCGKVPLYRAYQRFVTENVCVDWASSLHHNELLDRECDLTQALPFGDGEFDTIILSDVLEHLPEPALLWREMSRVLAQKGHLLLSVPFFYWLHEEPHDFYRYTKHALARFVAMSGLRLVELRALGGAPEVMADIIAKSAAGIPGLGVPLAVSAQWLTARFTRTALGKRVSEASSQQFPLGYFLVARQGD